MAETKKRGRPKKANPENSMMIDIRRVRKTDLKLIFGYSFQALQKWNARENGFENEDGTWDLVKCIRWREEKAKAKGSEDKSELEIQKLKKEIEFKDSQIQKNLRNLMERSLHEQVLSSRAATLRSFWEAAVLKNKHMFVMKTPEEISVLLYEFVKQGLDAYCSGGVISDSDV